jgi:hypothetical protein
MNGRRYIQRAALRALVLLPVLGMIAAASAGCSKKSVVEPVKKGKPGEEFVIQSSDRKPPRWTRGPEFDIKGRKSKKTILVTAEVYGPADLRAAQRLAESDLRRKVAEGIKTLVQSQFQEALAGSGKAGSERFESYVVTVADNVPVVGLVVTETYWEKIQRVKAKGQFEYVYRVYKRGSMPYAHYADARNKAWRDVVERRSGESERELLRELVEDMMQRDAE